MRSIREYRFAGGEGEDCGKCYVLCFSDKRRLRIVPEESELEYPVNNS